MTESDRIETWLSLVAYEHSQSKNTEEQYKRSWREFSKSTGMSAEEIIKDYEEAEKNHISERTIRRKHSQKIQEWIRKLAKRGLTTTSIKVMVGSVKSFYKYNDLPLGHIPQAKTGVVFNNKDLEKEEIIKIMALCPVREKAIFSVMAQSGLRPHTIKQLRIEHVERILESDTPLPCKITVPREIEKGKFGTGHPTFIGEESVRYIKQFLHTRKNLTQESLLFSTQNNKPINTKNTSRTFRLSAKKLKASGAIDYKVRIAKPSELRLYNLRKYFRKYANQMGFEHVNYLMGHTTQGSDSNYTPKDDEFYRKLYEEKAMPFLRFETPTPTETTGIIETLKTQHQKELESYKTENQMLKNRLDQNEALAETLSSVLYDHLAKPENNKDSSNADIRPSELLMKLLKKQGKLNSFRWQTRLTWDHVGRYTQQKKKENKVESE